MRALADEKRVLSELPRVVGQTSDPSYGQLFVDFRVDEQALIRERLYIFL